MKLRVRSVESKETLRIQLPTTCSLQDLKNAVAEKVSSLPESLHFSLNRKDELQDLGPQEPLQSLGITSGDLIFYTLDPNGFSRETLTQAPMRENPPIQASSLPHLESNTLKQPENSQTHVGDLNSEETPLAAAPNLPQGETLGVSETIDEYPCELEEMDVDESEIVGKSSSVPCFLRNVFKEEMGNAEGDRKLLIVAVHAVLLESGFVCYNSATDKKKEWFHLPEDWASMPTTLRVKYTVPDLVRSGCDVVETVVLKFQTLGKFVNVYGSLTNNGSDIYGLSLDESRFVASISFVWRNCDSIGDVIDKDGSSRSYHEKEVFEFWKIVKDGLALPLLVNLCEKTGLASPPCLMLLPTELKFRVLELLPGADIAKVGCVCSELRYLSSTTDLWKRKFKEEFGQSDGQEIQEEVNWKKRFSVYWERRKKRKINTVWQRLPGRERPYPFGMRPARRHPVPFGFPAIIGGEYDLLPGLGVPVPFEQGREFPRFLGRRNVIPYCNLGAFDA